MATNLYEGVFNQILPKTAKMAILRHFFNLPFPPPHFEDNWIFLTFHLFLIYRACIRTNLAGFVSV